MERIKRLSSFSCLLFPVYCLVSPVSSLAQIIFEKTYGGTSTDYGSAVQQTSDGGYIIAGLTYSFGAGLFDVYLIKTNAGGDTLWTKTYGGIDDDEGWFVQQTSDGGFIIAGYTGSFGAGADDGYLIKTDSLGDTLWTRTFGGMDYDYVSSVQQTSDGGYIIAGVTWSFGAGGGDCLSIKTGSDILDGGVVSLDAPGDTVFTDSTTSPKATVRNFGNFLVLTFNCIVTINAYAETVQVANLAPSTDTQIVFQPWTVPSTDSMIYTMTVCTALPNDGDTTNDCREKAIFAYNPVGVEEGTNYQLPITNYQLFQNHPNPFHNSTLIRYTIPEVGAYGNTPVQGSVEEGKSQSGSQSTTSREGWWRLWWRKGRSRESIKSSGIVGQASRLSPVASTSIVSPPE